MSFKKNIESLKHDSALKKILLYKNSTKIGEIRNVEGEKNSLKIYSHILEFENGTIDVNGAEKALNLFSEYVEESKKTPGKHPNIDRLIEIIKTKVPIQAVIEYDIPHDLEMKVLQFHEMKVQGCLLEKSEEALSTFNQLMDLLEKGHLRVANYTEKGWQVNKWIKKGILLGFKLGSIQIYNKSNDICFTDKNTFPLRKVSEKSKFRVVPPAAGLRRGSYAGKECVLMPPAYVNIGSYIGQKTMIENLAGSCCQVGRHCHISAGTIIGGVLDPIEASPVIIGDDVLLGESSGITQGARLGNLVTLAPGVHISKSTPVFDSIKGKVYAANGTFELLEEKNGAVTFYKMGKMISEKDHSYGPEIPSGALVISGATLSSKGFLKYTPIIAKYVTKISDRSYALEEALR